MICRTLRPRSAWSCATNMFWDTDQAITYTTPVGAKSRSNCARPRVFHHFRSTPRQAITLPPTESHRLTAFARFALFFLLLGACAVGTRAQLPIAPTPPPPPPGTAVPQTGQGTG